MRVDTGINIGDTVLWRGKERIVRSVKVIVKRDIDWERTEVIFYKVIGSKVWAREDELTYVHGFRTNPKIATVTEASSNAPGVGNVVLVITSSINDPKNTRYLDISTDDPMWAKCQELLGKEVNVWVEWKTDDTDKHHRYRTIAKIEAV